MLFLFIIICSKKILYKSWKQKFLNTLKYWISNFRDTEILKKIFVSISLFPDEFTEMCNLFESIEPEDKTD